jgi:hypothetical protein
MTALAEFKPRGGISGVRHDGINPAVALERVSSFISEDTRLAAASRRRAGNIANVCGDQD